MRSLLFAVLLPSLLGGCSCETPSDPDGGRDAATALDAPPAPDAPLALDAPSDLDVALDTSDPDAPSDAGTVCSRDGYPFSYRPTPAERHEVDLAAASFTAATGATPNLDDVTGAVTGFSGGTIPIALDAGIADPCARAEAGIRSFFAANVGLMHAPTDMVVRLCEYDSLTDSEVIRIADGRYQGRLVAGIVNDLVLHVTRSGTLRFFGGSYLPAYERAFPEPCLDSSQLAEAVVTKPLEFQRFSACIPRAPGSIAIDARDTRTVGEPRIYIDDTGNARIVREVEVLMAPDRVTSDHINSDLYCCLGTLAGCVGKILLVDEITGDILLEIPRCHLC